MDETSTGNEPVGAEWVWPVPPDAATARVSRARFALRVKLQGAAIGSLAVSARTRYDLRVNGVPMGTGPGRSYPEFREYDRYDLATVLTAGWNTIEAEVLHEDLATYHHLHEPPGFVAWGSLSEADGERHELATPGRWLCRNIPGVAADTPRLSFAQGPVESVDVRADSERSNPWGRPFPRTPKEASVPVEARRIPPLTRIVRPALAVTVTDAPAASRAISARVCFDGEPKVSEPPRGWWGVLVAWLHSPREQCVPAGCWWGEYFLNDAPLKPRPDALRPFRQHLELPLRAGWNRLAVQGGVYWGYWDFCMEWPTECRVAVGTRPDGELAPGAATEGFLVAGPMPRDALDRLWPLLFAGTTVPETVAWRQMPVPAIADMPLRRLLWTADRGAPQPVDLPVRIAAGMQTRLVADLGQLTLGRVAIELDAPEGTVIDVGHGEQAVGGRPRLDAVVTVYPADRWIAEGGRHRLETMSPRGFRHLEFLVGGHDREVTVHAIEAVEQRYPYEVTGSFACSDDAMNRLWSYGRRTLELCSEDVLIDCPWRERTLYGGDLLPQMAATAALTRDLRLVRRSLEVLLQSFDPSTGWLQPMAPFPRDGARFAEYPLLTSVAAGWYLRLTDDEPFARRAWPVFRGMAEAAGRMRRPDGLYSPPHRAFIDHARKVTEGPTCAFNAALAAALLAWAETAERCSEASAAAGLRTLATELGARLTEAFYEPAAQSFRDLPAGPGRTETEGTPANTWPLLFVPPSRERAAEVLATLQRQVRAFDADHEERSVSPYQMFYLLGALRELGAADLAEEAIRTVYGAMLRTPTGTLWEHGKPDASLVHAWSCGVNDYLSTAVLGVRMGFGDPAERREVRVAPCAHGIAWARGTVPHPLGDVTVAWERDGRELRIDVRAPTGVAVTIAPAGPLANLALRKDLRVGTLGRRH